MRRWYAKWLVAQVDEPYRTACATIVADHRALFATVQGSTHNHQAWRGGYLDHVTEVMNIAVVLYEQLSALRPPPTTNGLKYAEGELADYTNQRRMMGPLAALAHMCDVASARLWFDHPAAHGDPWIGATRCAG